MRITQRAITQTSLLGLNSNLAALNKLQQQLTSGTTISRPSDSPTGTNTSMLTRRSIADNDQQARNITDGTTVLEATDSALQDMLAQTLKVRDLTVQALNSGAGNAETRQAIASQVSGLRESMLGQANQVVAGRPLFGGVTSGATAYDDGEFVGVAFDEDVKATAINRRVSDNETIRVDVTGPEAFGSPDGSNLFAVVQNIATHTTGDDQPALTEDLAALDEAISRLTEATADVGTRAQRMERAGTTNSARALTLSAALAATEDVDLPKTIMTMKAQEVSYQAALQVTAQVLQPTLLDFLR
ncbi:flagellin N-terminal helical domain-containing protein [Modestobacter altitudinis]|uniref:flagellin N-terminal helical domain-containing protein n=1 Tax=Modestobacter altitudinis TaxID=2213158 RepID=UPI00110D02E6|nr:flagellin [Modestobacter altitudinis]